MLLSGLVSSRRHDKVTWRGGGVPSGGNKHAGHAYWESLITPTVLRASAPQFKFPKIVTVNSIATKNLPKGASSGIVRHRRGYGGGLQGHFDNPYAPPINQSHHYRDEDGMDVDDPNGWYSQRWRYGGSDMSMEKEDQEMRDRTNSDVSMKTKTGSRKSHKSPMILDQGTSIEEGGELTPTPQKELFPNQPFAKPVYSTVVTNHPKTPTYSPVIADLMTRMREPQLESGLADKKKKKKKGFRAPGISSSSSSDNQSSSL